MNVDEYVKTSVPSKHRAIVRAVRRVMRDLAPNSVEAVSYNMPVWKGRKIICWIASSGDHVNFGFTHGVGFEDRYGLLQGSGKVGRHIKLTSIRDVDKRILGYYVRQALREDAG
jgi:hypothetical protein